MFRFILIALLLSTFIGQAFGQSYEPTWRYQMVLEQLPDGKMHISYLKQAFRPPVISAESEEELATVDPRSFQLYGPVNAQTMNILPVMNNDGRINIANLMITGHNNKTGNPYQITLSYFSLSNFNIPVTNTLPQMIPDNRFPQPSRYEFYPMPHKE